MTPVLPSSFIPSGRAIRSGTPGELLDGRSYRFLRPPLCIFFPRFFPRDSITFFYLLSAEHLCGAHCDLPTTHYALCGAACQRLLRLSASALEFRECVGRRLICAEPLST